MSVTVAIPVLDGGATLGAVLDAVRAQDVEAEVEILVCDSGSTDGSRALARERGARVVEIAPGEFSHGGTRQLLADEAGGTHVAFLTQDAVPASDRWLAELLRGFTIAPDVALVFGPYRARPGAAPWVRRELDSWFGSFAPDGRPRIDRLEEGDGAVPPRALLGPQGFFTDANGCVAVAALERVPFRRVPYAEDHQLALDMLYAGFAKVYMPDAAVVHSHDYGLGAELRRAFDEWRGLREVYGYVEPARWEALRRMVVGPAAGDLRLLREEGAARADLVRLGGAAAAHHLMRFAGAALGARADRLPASLRRQLSLERRESFEPALPSPASR